jgi:hypothetical protein
MAELVDFEVLDDVILVELQQQAARDVVVTEASMSV